MKTVEDTDAPDVIVGNFQIFDTTVYALIDPGVDPKKTFFFKFYYCYYFIIILLFFIVFF